MGLYGAIWVIYHSIRKKVVFLGLAGAIIVSIAITDCVHSLIYGYDGFIFLLGEKDDLNTDFFRLHNQVFIWQMLTSAFLAITLAFNSLSIIYFGSGFREKFKYPIILTSCLLPFPIHFIPLILYTDQSFADFVSGKKDDSKLNEIFNEWFYVSWMCLSVFLIIGAYFAVYCKIRRFGDAAFLDKHSAKRTILDLILAYSMAHIVCTIPWIFYNVTCNNLELCKDTEAWYSVAFQIPRLIFTPLRGYIHALAVVIASKRRSSSSSFFKKNLYIALLVTALDTNETEEGLVQQAKEVTIEDIRWEFSNQSSVSLRV
jgi:magnesium-transporting ATPase (P-type)